jgi:hypothetical protein
MSKAAGAQEASRRQLSTADSNFLLEIRIQVTISVMRLWAIRSGWTFDRIGLSQFAEEAPVFFLLTHNARNPLKSHDSGEKIQGKPRKTKA